MMIKNSVNIVQIEEQLRKDDQRMMSKNTSNKKKVISKLIIR